MDYPVVSESGETIDALFSYKSCAARVVGSPEIIGTTNTLLELIAKKMIKTYRKEK